MKENNIETYSTYNEGKSVVAERFIKTLKNKIFKHMTAVSKNVYFDVLDNIDGNYNNTFHIIVGMKPTDVKSDSFAEYNVDSNGKILAKLKIQFHGLGLLAGIFPSTSLQPVNGSKNSILNWVMKLSLFIEVFSFFVFKTTLKDFPFYSSILFTLWFRYLPTHIKESCIYLSSQLFLKTPN